MNVSMDFFLINEKTKCAVDIFKLRHFYNKLLFFLFLNEKNCSLEMFKLESAHCRSLELFIGLR